MDLWVIAAAAGAGYIAKNLQNLSLDTKESLSGTSYKYPDSVQSESRNLLQQLRDKTCPLRRLQQRRARDDDVDDQMVDARDSESDLEKNRLLEEYNMGRISNLPPVFSAEEKLEFENGEIRNLRRVINGSKFTRIRRSRVPSSGICIDGPIHRENENQTVTQFEGCTEERRSENGPEGMLLFVTGMIVGIMAATAVWKNEVDKSNKQLKQMHNLVQDLHEELDMKDVLTVKEIDDEGYPPPRENDTPLSIPEPIASPYDAKNSKKDGQRADDDDDDRKTEDLEVMRKIEAELQAELEMLENNLKASALEKLHGVAESANYAVDPWELSLRLHELIESRLQERINELEIALYGDKLLGPVVPKREYSYSETESSSTHRTPACICYEREDGLFVEEIFYEGALLYKEPRGISLRMRDKDQENLID